jgi:hypothetical protein
MFQNPKKRAMRRGWPIMGYVGPNGGGKSAAMVWDTLPSLLAGRPVLSTVRILDWENPRTCEGCDEPDHTRPVFGEVILGTEDENGLPLREVVGYETHKQAHPLYVRLHRWEQILDAKSVDVLMDEVTGVASSRESQSMPAPVANLLVQLRRRDVVLRWSAPAWARSDKIIRECSQAVTYCQGRLPKLSDQGDRQWRQRRLFVWKTYDASDFEDFTSGKRENLDCMTSDLHWGPKSPVFQAYDTYDSVATIGTVSDAGRCYRCGGKRATPVCRCDSDSGNDHAGGKAARKAEGRHGRPRLIAEPTSSASTDRVPAAAAPVAAPG